MSGAEYNERSLDAVFTRIIDRLDKQDERDRESRIEASAVREEILAELKGVNESFSGVRSAVTEIRAELKGCIRYDSLYPNRDNWKVWLVVLIVLISSQGISSGFKSLVESIAKFVIL